MKKTIVIAIAAAMLLSGVSVFADTDAQETTQTTVETTTETTDDTAAEATEAPIESVTETTDAEDKTDEDTTESDKTKKTKDKKSKKKDETLDDKAQKIKDKAEEKIKDIEDKAEKKLDKLKDKSDDEDDEDVDDDTTKSRKEKSINRVRDVKGIVETITSGFGEYLNEIRDLFKDVDFTDRDEVLASLAEVKEKLEDFSIDTFVNGIYVDYDKYDGVKPVIENDRTLAPLRAVTESLGATVEWDADTETITITKDDNVIVMKIGEKTATVNGVEVDLDVAPKIKGSRTLVPLRFIAEAFDLDVDWDENSQTIIIE